MRSNHKLLASQNDGRSSPCRKIRGRPAQIPSNFQPDKKKKNICSLVKETTTTSAQRLSSSFRLHFVPSRRFSAHKVSILPTGLAVPSLNSGPSEATVQTATQTKPEPLHPLRQHSIPAAARDDDEPIVFYRLLRAFGCVRSGVSECV